LLRPETRPAYWNRVYGQELDALSLRVRAVASTLPLDGAKALELFQSIPPLKLPHPSCDEFLVYDVSRFYQVLVEVDSRSKDPAGFLQPYAAGIASPVEIAPMAEVLLGAAGLTDQQFETLVAAFAKALARIGNDDRSFTYAQIVPAVIEKLVAE